MMSFVEEYGLLGLMLISFAAATIIPMSSEGAVVGAHFLNFSGTEIIIWASVGNVSGVLFNYILGAWGGTHLQKKEKLIHTKAWKVAKKYGIWSLFLSWLPVIGDPITILAGLFRWHFGFFVLVSFSLRIFRYWLIIYTLS